jgi:hypothetical protein
MPVAAVAMSGRRCHQIVPGDECSEVLFHSVKRCLTAMRKALPSMALAGLGLIAIWGDHQENSGVRCPRA